MLKTKKNIDLLEMAEAGLHFGHHTSRIHPKMKPYLSIVRNGVNLIDLAKTKEKLEEALSYISSLIAEGGNLVLVGTKVQAKELVKETAQECGLPYVSERWLGGTFTNFGTIKKRINYFKELEAKKAEGELDKYTKKERLDIDKELETLEKKMGGIKELTKLPEAIFVLDIIKDKIAVKEALAEGVKVIALVDTNCDPSLIDYPIPSNDDAVPALKYILDKVKEVVLEAKPKIKE